MNNLLLSLLKDARLNQKSKPQDLDFISLYQLSVQHQIVPLIYNQIFSFPNFPADLKEKWKREAIRENAFQAIKTNKFLRIYQTFLESNLTVIVVKGIICRSLYPIPDNRPSNDEDLYVKKEEFPKASEILLKHGLQKVEESPDVTTFIDKNSGLSIELHTALFSEDSKAYGKYQGSFEHAFENTATHIIQDVSIYSLSYDLHLLFLIMHFVKHFLHGGVGIRQISDIIMYSETYANEIHWQDIYQTLGELNVLTLIENVFALAIDHLAFDTSKIILPAHYQQEDHDYQDLLDDIIDAGIFGKSSPERLHSSTMTLNATATGKTSVLKSAFPPVKSMIGRYPYLKKHPYLLPLAWLNRIYHYLTNQNEGNTQKTIEMGNRRIELLKKYKVIK